MPWAPWGTPKKMGTLKNSANTQDAFRRNESAKKNTVKRDSERL